jgi:hypothetical protein
MMKARNRTADGALACAFGTPWMEHFGRGNGCPACESYRSPAGPPGQPSLFGMRDQEEEKK